uniref:Uncharacterized protein n=1 Tax=Glossina brevipalpis TaxID=37001 RepID=A0A1A9X3Y0_9MUSC
MLEVLFILRAPTAAALLYTSGTLFLSVGSSYENLSICTRLSDESSGSPTINRHLTTNKLYLLMRLFSIIYVVLLLTPGYSKQ